MTTLALDIGGTKLLAALVENGRVTAEARLATDLAEGPEGLVAAAARAAAPWAGRYDRVAAAVTGAVREGEWRALNRATLDLAGGFPIEAALAARFGRPALALNDAQAAAWGEHVAGAGQGGDLAFLTVSTGVGGGLVLGGRLLGGLAGHFGQIRDEAGVRLEDRLAGRWMAAAARDAGAPAAAEAVFAALPAPWAEAVLAESARRFATLCANIQLMLDPARIVVGGGIGLAPGYLDRVRASLAKGDAPAVPDLRPAALGAHAGVLGAADLALRRFAATNHRETAQ